MSPVITERELAAACRETLRQWPQALAAVLFGSRARGTAHPDSDWDVAFVLEGGELRHPRSARSVFPRSELPADLLRVDVWAFSEDDLRRNARALGTLPYVVCRDGRVLAGEWNRPDPAQMEREAAVNPEDWTRRMELAWEKADAAIRLISRMAEAVQWRRCALHCSSFLEASANAAEFMVKAAMERRGVSADRTHDVAKLASAFAMQRPDERALAERMADLNGDSRTHHMTMYDFRLPEATDVQACVRRLAGTLDLWVSEVETEDGNMARQVPGLVRIAAGDMAAWPGLMNTQVTPKTDQGHAAQTSAEAALALRPELAEAIAAIRDRIRQVIEGPEPGEVRPGPSPSD